MKQQTNQQQSKEMLERASEINRAPGQATHGTADSSTSGTAAVSPSATGPSTAEDEGGNTLHQFMFDVDSFDDPTARFF